MAISRSLGCTSLTRRSPMYKSPAVIYSSPAIVRKRVDLPHPLGPTRTRNSPSRMSRSMPLSVGLALPYRFTIPLSVSPAMPFSSLAICYGYKIHASMHWVLFDATRERTSENCLCHRQYASILHESRRYRTICAFRVGHWRRWHCHRRLRAMILPKSKLA